MSHIDLTETIPSKSAELLSLLKGALVKDLIRCSWDTYEESNQYHPLERESFFQFTGGAFLIEIISGEIIGFGYQPSLASLTVWLERDRQGNKNPRGYFEDEDEGIIIRTTRNDYVTERIKKLVGQRIINVSILKRDPQSSLHVDLPNEAGIGITFEQGEEIILSYNLVKAPDDFCIIFKDDLTDNILNELRQLSIN